MTLSSIGLVSASNGPHPASFLLCQCDADNPRIHRYARFGSITLNDHESRFSQPKLELYGLFHTLRALKMYLIGVRNLVVEVDARYIKGMLANPDLAPSASMNRWIVSILLFHFTLIHVPGTRHGPDGLSRRPQQPGDDITDSADNPEFDDWVDQVYGFMHFLNPLGPTIAHPEICTTYVSKTLSECSTNHDPTDSVLLSYTTVPRLAKSQKMDERLRALRDWFITMQCPDNITDAAYTALIRYSMRFFAKDSRLWKKDAQGHHKVVINPSKRLPMLAAVHDNLGHHGDYVTRSHLTDRFWWPDMPANIAWFVKTCHVCQLRQTRNILIPPVVTTPTPLFAKMYMDTMHLPKSGGFKYLVQGRCSLTHFPEYRSLRAETGKTIGDWIFEDILC